MPKTKRQGGPRKTRRLVDLTSDIDMVEVDYPRSERLKHRAKNRSAFQARDEADRRIRTGKTVPEPQPFLYGARDNHATRAPSTAARKQRTLTTTRPPRSPLVPRASASRARLRQPSALSAMSTALSSVAAGPWCGRCERLNRRLHGYLLDILRTGEQAVDEWAHAVGASPDHMECEPAPERIIPEGYRRCSQQCQSCVAGRLAAAAAADSTPPASVGWSSAATALGAGQGQGQGHHNEMMPGGAQAPSSLAGWAQGSQGLVAIPEGQGLLHARWAGPPAQQQQPLPPPQQQTWGGAASQDRYIAGPDMAARQQHWEYPGGGAAAGPSGQVVLPPTPPGEPDEVARPRCEEAILVDRLAAFITAQSERLSSDPAPQWQSEGSIG